MPLKASGGQYKPTQWAGTSFTLVPFRHFMVLKQCVAAAVTVCTKSLSCCKTSIVGGPWQKSNTLYTVARSFLFLSLSTRLPNRKVLIGLPCQVPTYLERRHNWDFSCGKKKKKERRKDLDHSPEVRLTFIKVNIKWLEKPTLTSTHSLTNVIKWCH